MELIDGIKIAQDIKNDLKQELTSLNLKPCLVIFLVGENPASLSYVTAKVKAAEETGINAKLIKFPATITESKLLSEIKKHNEDIKIHGIIVQLPLPKHIAEEKIIEFISAEKDVDGFHPINLGKLMRGEKALYPATPAGIQELLIRSGNHPKGKHVVIIGRSNLVGKPMLNLLIQKNELANATVTIVHSETSKIEKYTKQADIIICAIGKPFFLKKEMIKKGAVIIDVGTNKIIDLSKKSGFRLVGDTDFENIKSIAKAITPVPGGVGPMTIAMLLKNTVEAAKKF